MLRTIIAIAIMVAFAVIVEVIRGNVRAARNAADAELNNSRKD